MAKERVMADAVEKVQLNVDKGVEIINSHLKFVESAGESAARSMYVDMPRPEVVFRDLRNFLDGNPSIQGILIGFRPGVFDKYGIHDFCPIVERSDTGIIANNALETNPRLYEKEWYEETRRVGHSRWGNVMKDVNGPNIVCYCIPLHDRNGEFLGVMTVSLLMNTFSDLLSREIHPYEHSAIYVTDREQHFLVHPDHQYILKSLNSFVQDRHLTIDEALWQKFTRDETAYGEINNRFGENSIVCYAPIKSTGWHLSLICPTDDILAGYYSMTRMMFLIGLLSILLLALLCYYLYRRIFREVQGRTSIESEVRIAAGIQMAMIPREMSRHRDFDIYAMLHPAKSIGGDLYDYRLKDDKIYFCIGDVSGKGVPASIVMAVVQSMFATSINLTDSPARIASNINNVTSERNEANMFCTMFVGVLDLRSGLLTYCNAGHNRPVLLRSDAQEAPLFMDVKPNIPLGVMEGFPYSEETCQLFRGDKIFIYTDGVTEATDIHEKIFGDEATLQYAVSHRNDGVREFLDNLLDTVHEFSKGAEQSDDITMLCLEWKGVDDLTLQLTNDVGELKKCSPFIDEVAKQLELPKKLTFKVHLAVDEMLANVVNYAYGKEKDRPITVTARKDSNGLICEIIDEGLPFNPLEKAPEVDTSLSAEDRPIGGLGIFLSQNMVSRMEYERREGKNVLRMYFE